MLTKGVCRALVLSLAISVSIPALSQDGEEAAEDLSDIDDRAAGERGSSSPMD